MTPIIYPATKDGTIDYSDAGAGFLTDVLTGTIDEILNGQFILNMTYPINGVNADKLVKFAAIKVDYGTQLKQQLFIIKQVTKSLDGVLTIYAEHISYLTLDLALKPTQSQFQDGQGALNLWKSMLIEHSDLFTVTSDKSVQETLKIGSPDFANARIALGGQAGSILDLYGGEYKFDNYHIYLLTQRGRAQDATIRYGKNLTTFTQEENLSGVYTSIVPYATVDDPNNSSSQTTHFLNPMSLDCDNADDFPHHIQQVVDFSDKFGTGDGQVTYSDAQLKTFAQQYMKDNNFGKPVISIEVNAIDLKQSLEKTNDDPIELGDTVNVFFETLGIIDTAECTEAVYDFVLEQYTSYVFGAHSQTLGQALSSQISDAQTGLSNLQQSVQSITDLNGTTTFWANSGDTFPDGHKKDDTLFVTDGSTGLVTAYHWEENATTGEWYWQKAFDTNTADEIASKVSNAESDMKAYASAADLPISQAASAAASVASQASSAASSANSQAIIAYNSAAQAINSASAAMSQAGQASSAASDVASDVAGFHAEFSNYSSAADSQFTSMQAGISANASDVALSAKQADLKQATNRLTTAESNIQVNANAITQMVTQSDYDNLTGSLQTQINTVTDTANSHTQTISQLQTQVNNLGQINLVQNS
ncbi:MAG: phage tail spike protein, partial [Oenococcus sp.]|uniref:phage tail spike protein n=1 Tax=Oenococcus sp. TaxID=1979414 RepID=UPI0039EC8822